MADCSKIIRLLKDVKKKADYSFGDLNKKLGNMEGQYNLLDKQIKSLKKKVDGNQLESGVGSKPGASLSCGAKKTTKTDQPATSKLGKRRRLRRKRGVGRRKKPTRKSRLTAANKGRTR